MNNAAVRFTTNAAERMRIDSSGNVGIGGISPAAKFVVSSGLSLFGTNTSDGYNTIQTASGFGLSGVATYYTELNHNLIYNSGFKNKSGGAASQIVLQGGTNSGYTSAIKFLVDTNPISTTANTTASLIEAMRIDNSGIVLVGTTSAGSVFGAKAKLEVVATTNQGGSFRTNSGYIPIGCWANYDVAATTGTFVAFYNGSAQSSVGSIGATATTTAYNTSSDYRLKNSVASMTTGLATVTALKPVTYKWNIDDSDGEGFIAHELQAVIPHAVTGAKDAVDADGNPIHQGVDYSKIVVHLVAAIQELKAELDQLKNNK